MSILLKLAPYSKFVVSLLGTVSIALTTFAGGAHWADTAVSLIAAVLVYLVPNKPKPTIPTMTPHP